MSAVRLKTIRVEKPWGRHALPAMFGGNSGSAPVGEIWFTGETGADEDLLVKFLFTSERLSIQVHPDDPAARASGHPRGKDEAWLILDGEEDARIGMGLVRAISSEALRLAALDGSIEQLVDWRRVSPDDCFYSPAGTVHAIGAGLVLLEVQQNVDLTYRLYDYGRPRELHLEDGIAVSRPEPFEPSTPPPAPSADREMLASGPAFTMERWRGPRRGIISHDAPVWVIALAGGGEIDGDEIEPGNVWIANGKTRLSLDDEADIVVAYGGQDVPGRLLA